VGLKLVSGKFRGKTLATTDNARELRPTQSLIREAIINTCLSYFDFNFSEIKVLDIFAGTGAVGFEFMSNSAKSVLFIERDPKCTKLIKANVQNLQLNTSAKIFPLTAEAAIKKLSKNNFEIIFLDPPYSLPPKKFQKIVENIFEGKLLSEHGLLIIESGSGNWLDQSFDGCLSHLQLVKKKEYGDSSIFFYTSDTEK
jgi:16S rRNA (guanine(966)-N(2))-methyltransferase RsmD